MIDRTTFDLRIAAHDAATATINRTDWRRRGGPESSAIRATLAAALVALAVRLSPGIGRPHGPRRTAKISA
jgi:hypothetical protein